MQAASMPIKKYHCTDRGMEEFNTDYWNKMWGRDHEHQNQHHKRTRRLLIPGGKIVATLLNVCFGHDWTAYPKVSESWHIFEETKWQ